MTTLPMMLIRVKYGIEELTFYDDVMSLNRKATMKLLDAMNPENLGFNLVWDAETRVDLVDQEMLFAMKVIVPIARPRCVAARMTTRS